MHWKSLRDNLPIVAEVLVLQAHTRRDAFVNSVDWRLNDRARLAMSHEMRRSVGGDTGERGALLALWPV
jgi:hypothetical protein